MGKYEILCRLAAGGMAEIFLAYQRGLAGFRKIVVLKSILPDIRGEEELTRMFLAEAQITAQFNHPHIAQVFDLDIDGDVLFLAMEFVQGCTLIELARALDKAKEAMPVGFTLRAVRDTALALNYAHGFTDPRGRKQPVIHRDVAEKNIMVTHEGVTKLLDFGIAKSGERKMTMVGTVKGSTGYMSPEQIRGETVDTRSDIFSLGVVMHECLTGYRLFRGKTPEESMMKALEGDVHPPSHANPDVGPQLDAVVLKALERDREHRYATALDFARDIERVAGHLIWQQEQGGALIQRHFSSRKNQVRELILGMESSGEQGISDVVKVIQAARGAALTEIAPQPVMPPALPVNERTVPASISDVQRALKPDEKTEEVPALPRGPVPAPIDFSLSPDPELTPSAPVTALENVTDLTSALVPANPPGQPPPLRDALPTAAVPAPPLAATAMQGPTPSGDPSMVPTTVAAPRRPPSLITSAPPQPGSPSRRIRRGKPAKSRAPLYGLIALVWAAAVVAVLMVLQVGPFRHTAPVVVVPPRVVTPPAPEAPAPAVEGSEAVEAAPAEGAPAEAPPEPKAKPKRKR
ncbi:MAG: serine/threonine protein kinase [Myxococcaceae bacterium]|nr:serine/threonine protein kinase [Myxococcaceae bacterium]